MVSSCSSLSDDFLTTSHDLEDPFVDGESQISKPLRSFRQDLVDDHDNLSLLSDFHLTPLPVTSGPTFGSSSFDSPFERSNPSFEEEGSPEIPALCHSPESSPISILFTPDSTRGRTRVPRCLSPQNDAKAGKWFNYPDRFLGTRDSPLGTDIPFRLSKSPQQLTPDEKILRRRSLSVDPFAPGSPPLSTQGARLFPVSPIRMTPQNLGSSVRQISGGAVWNVGGSAAASDVAAARDGPSLQEAFTHTVGNSPTFDSGFLDQETPRQDLQRHESRVALALEVDQANRILNNCSTEPFPYEVPKLASLPEKLSPLTWKNNGWTREREELDSRATLKKSRFAVPSTPFRVLDAPHLRNDFYCSPLAYCSTLQALAVALCQDVYIWSETRGVNLTPFAETRPRNHVNTIAFSSQEGGKCILVVGRRSGQLALWSLFDSDVRFELQQPIGITSLSFKETTTRRRSEAEPWLAVDTEELLVGDDSGVIWFYSIEWTTVQQRSATGWKGAVSLLAKICAHTQQICGLAWSPDGKYLASGGNDNCCLVFDVGKILGSESLQDVEAPRLTFTNNAFSLTTPKKKHAGQTFYNPDQGDTGQTSNFDGSTSSIPSKLDDIFARNVKNGALIIPASQRRHIFHQRAAVKALAFAPWQPTLLATGGGSNDRCIRFFHVNSGACLASIKCHSQITSLIWSKMRRELVATFGYAQPDHPYRIAVFKWPECETIVRIPWALNESVSQNGRFMGGRALWAIPYPGGPNDSCEADKYSSSPGKAEREGRPWSSRTAEEGCIVVASSEGSIKFHEVWAGGRAIAGGGGNIEGMFGGSDILEALEGIEKEYRNETIR